MKLTTEQERKLRELCGVDAPNAEIASILGILPSEVYANRSRLGITRAKCGFFGPYGCRDQSKKAPVAQQAKPKSKDRPIDCKYIKRLDAQPVTQNGKKYYVCLVDAKAYDDKI